MKAGAGVGSYECLEDLDRYTCCLAVADSIQFAGPGLLCDASNVAHALSPAKLLDRVAVMGVIAPSEAAI